MVLSLGVHLSVWRGLVYSPTPQDLMLHGERFPPALHHLSSPLAQCPGWTEDPGNLGSYWGVLIEEGGVRQLSCLL